MYIKTPYIIISSFISSRISPMYIETPYIINICRVISSRIGPMYIETPYICKEKDLWKICYKLLQCCTIKN